MGRHAAKLFRLSPTLMRSPTGGSRRLCRSSSAMPDRAMPRRCSTWRLLLARRRRGPGLRPRARAFGGRGRGYRWRCAPAPICLPAALRATRLDGPWAPRREAKNDGLRARMLRAIRQMYLDSEGDPLLRLRRRTVERGAQVLAVPKALHRRECDFLTSPSRRTSDRTGDQRRRGCPRFIAPPTVNAPLADRGSRNPCDQPPPRRADRTDVSRANPCRSCAIGPDSNIGRMSTGSRPNRRVSPRSLPERRL